MFVHKGLETTGTAARKSGAITPEWAFANPRRSAPGAQDRSGGSCSCGGGCRSCRQARDTELSGAVAPAGDARSEELDIDLSGFGDLVGPPQFSVTAATTSGPTWGSCRAFDWIETWATDGRSGFIVQEINNSGSITRCDGTSQTPPNTPRFWEAWPVDASGVVGDGGADLWHRAARPGTSGSWTLTGDVGFVAALDPAAGFSRTAVPDANGLLATTIEPTGMYMATLHRRKGGVWNCCGGNNFHNAA